MQHNCFWVIDLLLIIIVVFFIEYIDMNVCYINILLNIFII